MIHSAGQRTRVPGNLAVRYAAELRRAFVRFFQPPYAMPFGDDAECRREISAQELGALLSGIDLSQAKRRKRYQRKSTEAS